MKQSPLVDSCSYSRVFRCVFFLLFFCIIFVPTTHAQVIHRRLWPWPSWPPLIRPRPWGKPPAPSPSPTPGPAPKPAPPNPCPPTPPPPPAPSPSPCPPTPPKPPPGPSPSPCPPTPPKPQPKPQPAPGPAPNPGPFPSPPKPPNPTPKPIPPPSLTPKPIPPPSPAPPPAPPKPENKTIPAVFFFGDSVLDTGNNNDRNTKVKSNYRPYGMDFKHGVATGRFSNGMVASDYISKYLGVKEIVPAYLDSKLQPNDLLTGVSFASGGAGYIPSTSKSMRAIPMMDQLKYFQDYIEKVNKLVRQENSEGFEENNKIIAKGVAIVVAGGNDLINTYFGSGAQRLKDNVDSYTTIMADSAASFVTQLYGFGARRIGVVGTPPLGCTPSQRVNKKKKCNEELNYAAQLFNSKLLIILGELSKTLPNSTLVYMDVYSIFSRMQKTPDVYGFEETKKPCCKTGILEGGGMLCKKSTSKICPNTSSFMFWDGIHLSQSAYEILNKVLVKEHLHVLSK